MNNSSDYEESRESGCLSMGGEITTKYGKLKGVMRENCITYFGVPFAKPPIGNLRFEPPMEPDSYEGVLLADHFREKAIQKELNDLPLWGKEFYQNPEYNVPASEDCLYLNIWAPKDESLKDCPVAVWIHGGAFKNGYPSEMEFDGEAYAKRGIILVTIAYRCNMFGFLPTPGDGIRTNLGLLDQIQALKWVHENIAFFGGNPHNVTLFGQSAGAMSTLYLCNSPYTENLISKAIFQSGASYKTKVVRSLDMKIANRVYKDLLKASGCETLEELKQIPAMELYDIFDKLPIMSKLGILSPVVDGKVVPMELDDSIGQKNMRHIPYIMGVNKDDMAMNRATKDKPKGGMWKGTTNLATALSKMDLPVYVYYFVHDLPGNNEGAFHSAELWYVFGTLNRSWRPMTDEDRNLSSEMIDCWASFMKCGNPDNFGKEEWQMWPKGYKTFE